MPDLDKKILPPEPLTEHGARRRTALTCMAWAGAGMLWTMNGGVLPTGRSATGDGAHTGNEGNGPGRSARSRTRLGLRGHGCRGAILGHRDPELED